MFILSWLLIFKGRGRHFPTKSSQFMAAIYYRYMYRYLW